MWHSYHYSYLPFGLGWGIILLLVVPYFIPTIIAFSRGKSSAAGVFILNFFLGWTLIGWVGALIWALSADNRTQTVIVNNPPPPPPPPHSQGYTNVTVRRPSTPPPTQQDKIDQLRQLKQLKDEGVLTEEEFNRQKAAILG